MNESKVSKEILELLADADPHIETGSAMVGLLTEYMKKINDKVPLNDLLMEIGKFLKSEIVPSLEAVDKELFRQRNNDGEGWADVLVSVTRKLGHLSNDGAALAITLQMMQNSANSAKHYADSVSSNFKKSKE